MQRSLKIRISSPIFTMNLKLILSLIIALTINFDGGQCLSNGNETVGDDFTYHIYLRNRAFHSCSGVVMDEWHILTAAHCVYRNIPIQLSVYASAIALIGGFVEIYDVRKIHVHKDYQSSTMSTIESSPRHPKNDIAILTLETPLLLGRYIEKVQLPMVDVTPCSASQCSIAGWGLFRSEDRINPFAGLTWTDVTIIPPPYCEAFEISIRENELCVSESWGMTRVHNVDTGGGLVCDGILVGIMVTSNADADQPTVHANVYHFLEFINEIKEEDRELYCHLPDLATSN